MSDEDCRLTWIDKILISLCSLALVLIVGTAFSLLALIWLFYGPSWMGWFR